MNALVSHEMRNPLNAILSMIDKIGIKCKDLAKFFSNPASQLIETSRQSMSSCVQEIVGSIKILKSASKLLSFTVSDMLSVAQIKNEHFRKNLELINIKTTIEEVFQIQIDKYEMKRIEYSVDYSGFDDRFMVCTDKHRL